MDGGGQCVMIFGIQQILMWLVVSLDSPLLPDQPAIALAAVQGKIHHLYRVLHV